MKLEPGERVAIFGPLSRFWPAAEFATLGFGGVAVGLVGPPPTRTSMDVTR